MKRRRKGSNAKKKEMVFIHNLKVLIRVEPFVGNRGRKGKGRKKNMNKF